MLPLRRNYYMTNTTYTTTGLEYIRKKNLCSGTIFINFLLFIVCTIQTFVFGIDSKVSLFWRFDFHGVRVVL